MDVQTCQGVDQRPSLRIVYVSYPVPRRTDHLCATDQPVGGNHGAGMTQQFQHRLTYKQSLVMFLVG